MHLQLNGMTTSVAFESIFFVDDFSVRELTARDIEALLALKDQIRMMLDNCNELPWNLIVEQAKELEKAFLDSVEMLGLNKDKEYDINKDSF